ncbi:MAG TPA: glycerol-3-phosphate 1-O-acyltransferase PlsY [Hyphomicrobiales bacterium]|nr:glycerol-3-phosphate 1-O-acyltransferase PlsY [Hyphomicrobiales bacterium]
MTEPVASAGALALVLVLFFGYVLGSIPFGVLFTRLAGLGDLRAIGSGNIGTTNVLRTGRKDLAALTLVFDALKGTVAVLVAWHWGYNAALVAGFGAFIGHLFPVWLRFRGGKGVATYLGLLIAFSWIAALVFAVLWLATAAAARYSSLAAIVALIGSPIAVWLLGLPAAAVLFAILSVIALVRHHENIRRLLAGTESRIGAKAAPPPGAAS